MYNLLERCEMNDSGTTFPDPFAFLAAHLVNPNVVFANRGWLTILGIEVGQHGDRGINGARGSSRSFARLPVRTVVGHSHSPSIEKGCYTVGTSSLLQMEYNSGASTWKHAHVIIHPNAERQMIFINKSNWQLNMINN
jgi:hypothetical protein